jgi:hypothetical protein
MSTKKTAKKSRALPKGFSLARQKLDGFFERAPDNTVTGILRGSFKVRGRFGEKTVYRIELTEGETQVNDGEMVGPGSIIGLDETGYTKVLGELPAGCGVFVAYEGKGSGAKDPHVFTVARADA